MLKQSRHVEKISKLRSFDNLIFDQIKSLAKKPKKKALREKLARKLKYPEVFSRSSMISEELVGKSIKLYNGYVFKPIRIIPEMVGHKFGEFFLTKQFPFKIHSSKKSKGKRTGKIKSVAKKFKERKKHKVYKKVRKKKKGKRSGRRFRRKMGRKRRN